MRLRQLHECPVSEDEAFEMELKAPRETAAQCVYERKKAQRVALRDASRMAGMVSKRRGK